jgi:two-component system cell cycle response regulator
MVGDSREMDDEEGGSTVRVRTLDAAPTDARPTVRHMVAGAPVPTLDTPQAHAHAHALTMPAPPLARMPLDTPRELVVPTASAGAQATLTAMSGLEAGRVYSIDADEMIVGRAQTAHVWVDDPSVSRRHARIVRHDAEPYVLEDLGSTNGTFIGDRRIERAELASGDRVQIGPSFYFRFSLLDMREEALQKDLFHAATRDTLSGLYNRRYFNERLGAEVSRARRSSRPLALLMLDLDQFKSINDAHGHVAGDQVLRAVSAHLGKLVRLEDVLARYGGEEFVLLAPGSDAEEAAQLAERLRAAVEHLAIHFAGAKLGVSVSIGVASLGELDPHAVPTELVARADARLYDAKRRGRNRVTSTSE